MKLRYQAQKGLRVKRRGFCWITNFDGYWWVHRQRRWVHSREATGPRCDAYFGCRSVRAFRRLLRKWGDHVPAGTEFIFVSRYKGHLVYGRIPKR